MQLLTKIVTRACSARCTLPGSPDLNSPAAIEFGESVLLKGHFASEPEKKSTVKFTV